MSESIWSDEPPTRSGYYYLRDDDFSEHRIAYFNHVSKRWWYDDQEECHIKYINGLKFGPRVPDAKRCAEIERGSDGNN